MDLIDYVWLAKYLAGLIGAIFIFFTIKKIKYRYEVQIRIATIIVIIILTSALTLLILSKREVNESTVNEQVAIEKSLDSIRMTRNSLKRYSSELEKKIVQYGSKIDNDSLSELVREQVSRLTVSTDKLEIQMKKLIEQNKGLQQALNPTKPEEVITISRLKDEIEVLKKDQQLYQKFLDKDHQNFKESIRHETGAINTVVVALVGFFGAALGAVVTWAVAVRGVQEKRVGHDDI